MHRKQAQDAWISTEPSALMMISRNASGNRASRRPELRTSQRRRSGALGKPSFRGGRGS
jgi:hypothetical protein